ncbi:PLP-dependent aminotransferase family protein [Salinarimonas rosea]|uniref:MocR-like pyridoxine biosynthesis transcription factor PdxR n=1 Tax=Salinarimonas rosea TaxID=552063 RepID=UPI0003F690A5|nr:PLP-dependent aminotransferase family protein [Salinarimonas rosea]
MRSLVEAMAPDGGTIVARLFRALREGVRSGHLEPGVVLPSSRRAAAALGISRNSVNAAYELLRAEGLVAVDRRRAPVVTRVERLVDPAGAAGEGPALSARGRTQCGDLRTRLYADASGRFRPGAPDEPLFPRDLWARALRRAARTALGPMRAYDDYAGAPALRRALADHLRRERGLVVAPDDVVVTASSQAALSLLAACLCDPGETVLIEEPGYLGARAAFETAALRVAPLPVDEAGADIEAATGRTGARLAYVTPSNQYPLCTRMSLPRRAALIAWARAARAVVVEDDYDGEFHWRGPEAGAMQPLAPDAVVYLGSAAKSLLPALRIGWMVAPRPLASALARAVRNAGCAANVHAQLALAELIESGAWKLHLRRVTRTYETRARLLVEAIRAAAGDRVEVALPPGGLQLSVRMESLADEAAAVAGLGAAGYAVARLSGFSAGEAPVAGLLVSFAEADGPRATAFAAALGRSLGPREGRG